LTLRPWRDDATDIATVLLASTDAEIRRFSSVGLVRNHVDAHAWLESRRAPERIDWAIEREDVVVGRVGLHRVSDEDGDAEIGYWLLPDARGAGAATTAVLAICEWAFSHGRLGRLEIRHVPVNGRSCALAERCGFTAEGLQRGALLRQGVRYDLHLHGRLATDPA
jgi:RimJ/RimL family protein N-acetyltransferase